MMSKDYPAYADIPTAIEMIGLDSNSDINWILGSDLLNVANQDRSAKIKHVGQSLLIRALIDHPEYAPKLPELPNINDVFERTKVIHLKCFPNGPDLTQRYFGVLIGMSAWSMTRYLKGDVPPTANMMRVLFALNKSMSAGSNSYRAWVDMVSEEAKSRGFSDIKEVLLRGNWKPA